MGRGGLVALMWVIDRIGFIITSSARRTHATRLAFLVHRTPVARQSDDDADSMVALL